MAVLIEGISVVTRVETIETLYPGGLSSYHADCPNPTFCSDGSVVRVGFMTPDGVGTFVDNLEEHGFRSIDPKAMDEEFLDLAVVDQNNGPTRPCRWLCFDKHPDGYSFAWKADEDPGELNTPEGWVLEGSLSKGHHFVPLEDIQDQLEFLRTEGNVDVYLEKATGKEVYMGRAGNPEEGQTKEYHLVSVVARPGSDLARRFDTGDEDIQLPFLVTGKEFGRFEKFQELEMSEWQLLGGILVGYDSDFQSDKSRKVLAQVLERLSTGFDCDSMEQAILDATLKIREEYGHDASYLGLKTGMTLLPYSSKIRSDFIHDIIDILDTVDTGDSDATEGLLEEILLAFEKIDIEDILEGAHWPVIFMNFVALKMLSGNQQAAAFVDSVAKKYVKERNVLDKMDELIRNPDATLSDCIDWE